MFRKLAALAVITSSIMFGGSALAHEKGHAHTHDDVDHVEHVSPMFDYTAFWKKVSSFDFSSLFKK